MFFTQLKFLLLIITASLLASCFDSREEIWINADSSGAARITLTLPALATKIHGGEPGVKKMLEDYLNASTAFSSYSITTLRKEDLLEIDVAVIFDNVMELRKLSESPSTKTLPPGSAGLIGITEIAFEKLSVNFARQVDYSKSLPIATLLPPSQLTGHKITTIYHLPRPPSAHNATTTSADGRTLTWETTLATAFQGPIATTFTMPIPIPWVIISIALTLVIFLLGLLGYWIYRRKNKPAIN